MNENPKIEFTFSSDRAIQTMNKQIREFIKNSSTSYTSLWFTSLLKLSKLKILIQRSGQAQQTNMKSYNLHIWILFGCDFMH